MLYPREMRLSFLPKSQSDVSNHQRHVLARLRLYLAHPTVVTPLADDGNLEYRRLVDSHGLLNSPRSSLGTCSRSPSATASSAGSNRGSTATEPASVMS